eukprot:CAMPEP_0172487786 /NCGR_PEP_ID=MMETSP1066-20121228/17001_1 /TAXON_ID=671091 /ORGANISM="Coscinodiscus wailesii, Strain CCMP2513" /LENGTH=883 /DNA_ID=CAMNT_0013254611 /DNA_START=232 /DNA_END=2883 /DNA_ORIENTATION=+
MGGCQSKNTTIDTTVVLISPKASQSEDVIESDANGKPQTNTTGSDSDKSNARTAGTDDDCDDCQCSHTSNESGDTKGSGRSNNIMGDNSWRSAPPAEHMDPGGMKRATSMAAMSRENSIPGLRKSTSLVGLDTFIETRKGQGNLTHNMVRIEIPFGKPIEDVYDGVHDGHILGSGISGVVRLCVHKKTGVRYAVKCLDLGLINADGIEQLREEIFVMCQLDHPNIVRLEEVYESTTEIYLVMELCVGGELFDRLDEQPDYHYTEQDCARLVKQMLKAVRYLHSKGVVHRDLKLENFLFMTQEDDSELKMIDFGLSKHFKKGEFQDQAVGTPYTVAPEVIRGKYDERCDVWAIGVITYLLLSGDPPFGGCGGPETLLQIRKKILRGVFVFEPEDIWELVSQEAKDFISDLLITDPKQRPTAREAQHSQWLQEWAVKGTKADNNVLSANVVQALVTFKEYDAMQKLLCEVLSFTLLPEQIQDLRGEFETLDKDGSGEISLAALKKVLMANAGAGSLGALTEEEVEDIFNAMRVRKTETTINWHEFIAAGLSQCKVDDRNLRLAFDRLDSDHKGYISFGDICDLMGLNDTSDESKRLKQQYLAAIRACCSSQTHICYDEFLLLMKGQKKQEKPESSLSKLEQQLNMRDHLGTSIHSSNNNLLTVPEDEEANSVDEEGPAFDEDDMFGLALDSSSHSKSSYRSTATGTSIVSATKLLLDSQKRHDIIQDLTEGTNQTAPTPLTVNRNLYRAHRTMRLAVLEASKRFEEMQVKRVFQEEVKKSMTSYGAGLVMKHGETKKLSTEEVHKILHKRQEERNNLVQKAKRKSGRRQKNCYRKKTVSDVSGMVGDAEQPEQGENSSMNSPVMRTSQRNRMLSNPEAAGFFADQ